MLVKKRFRWWTLKLYKIVNTCLKSLFKVSNEIKQYVKNAIVESH